MFNLNGKSDKNKQLDFLQIAVKQGRMTTVRATCLFHAGMPKFSNLSLSALCTKTSVLSHLRRQTFRSEFFGENKGPGTPVS